MKTRLALSIFLALGPGVLPLFAADSTAPANTAVCSPDAPADDCTLGQIYNAVYEKSFPPDVVTDQDVESAVVNTNIATTTPDNFANRIHSSYQDFLNLFSFAINKVEESKDGQALIVRFNPLREGRQFLDLSVTVAKPAVSDLVSDAIPEAERAATVAKAQTGLGDFDDVTYAVAYSLAATTCSWAQPASSRCWGRNPAIYRQMLASVLVSANDLAPAADIAPDDPLINRLIELVHANDLFKQKISSINAQDRAEVVSILRQLAAKGIQGTRTRKAFFTKAGLDKLASLIDNQPQLAATGSYRDPGPFGGPDETGVSLELQYGLMNLNKLRRQCGAATDCVVRTLTGYATNGLPTDKFVLTASYKQLGEYTLDQLVIDSAPVPGFTPIHTKKSTELKARLQWGRLLSTQVAGRNARFDLSADGIQTRDDAVRTKNRWVASATLTLPLGDSISIPISLNYANRPEFLTGQTKQLGVHLGLTYRLPFENFLSPAP
ncbi:MAG TPA: hypothetical protein VIJ61_17425 [Thermoanaerobaculia bacterium]